MADTARTDTQQWERLAHTRQWRRLADTEQCVGFRVNTSGYRWVSRCCGGDSRTQKSGWLEETRSHTTLEETRGHRREDLLTQSSWLDFVSERVGTGACPVAQNSGGDSLTQNSALADTEELVEFRVRKSWYRWVPRCSRRVQETR